LEVALTLGVAQSGHAAEKTFLDYCNAGKAGNTLEVWHMVELMMVEERDCDAAWQKLTGLTELDLKNNQITDITPLKGLTGLWWLRLKNNPIDPAKCPTSQDTATEVRKFCVEHRDP